jgi:hypothetical protein
MDGVNSPPERHPSTVGLLHNPILPGSLPDLGDAQQ